MNFCRHIARARARKHWEISSLDFLRNQHGFFVRSESPARLLDRGAIRQCSVNYSLTKKRLTGMRFSSTVINAEFGAFGSYAVNELIG